MAGRTAILAVRIISDAKGAASGFGAAGGMIGKLGGLALGAGAAVVALGIKAGDLEQSIGAVDTVFERSATQIHKWAQSAATDVGLTRAEYNELGTLIGTQLANGGTAMDQLAPKTNDLIKLGADLSSMFGGSTKDAVAALSSALKGERDPIERYGVSLKQAQIDAKAAELGFAKVGGSLSNEAQQAATLALISEQTAKAHGNFARETDTLAHQQQVAAAQVENLTTQLGTVLLPIGTKVFGWLNTTAVPILAKVVAGAEQLADWIGPKLAPAWDMLTGSTGQAMPLLTGAGQVFGRVAGWAQGQLVPALRRLWDSFSSGLAIVARVVLDLQQRVMGVLGPMMPRIQSVFGKIGGIVTAAMDLIGAVITATATAIGWIWDTFGGNIMAVAQAVWGGLLGIISPALDAVQAIISTVTAALRGDWQGVWDGISAYLDATWRTIQGALTGALNVLHALWTNSLGALSTLIGQLLTPVVAWFGGIGDRIKTALGNVGDILVRAGRAIIDGFLGGLKDSWRSVTDFVGGIADWIAANKGPIDVDRRLLVPAGQAIMTGLRRGMAGELPNLRATLGQVTDLITDTVTVDADVQLNGSSRSAATAPVVNITVNGAVDARATARQLRTILNTDARVRGVVDLDGVVMA